MATKTLEKPFSEFLMFWRTKPVTIGVDDCGPWVLIWVSKVTRYNFEKFIPIYDNRRQTVDYLRRGWVDIGSEALADFETTDKPVCGDVAIVTYRGRIFPAIKGQERWWSRGHSNGVAFGPVKVLKAWDINKWVSK